MDRTLIQMVGLVFGRLTVVARDGKDRHGQAMWACRCSCGGSTTVRGAHLLKGTTVSCGCALVDFHQRDDVREAHGS